MFEYDVQNIEIFGDLISSLKGSINFVGGSAGSGKSIVLGYIGSTISLKEKVMFFTEGSICHKPLKDNMNIEFENIVRENDNLQMVEKSIKEGYKNIIIDCPFEYLVNNYMLYPHYQTKIILIEKLKSIIQDNKDVNLFLSIQGKIPHNELEESYRPQIFDHSIYQNSSLLLYTYQECGRIRVEIVKNRYGYNKDRELYL